MRRIVAAVAGAGLLVSVAPAAEGLAESSGTQPAARTAAAARIAAPRSPLSYEAPPRGNRAVEVVQWRNPRSSALKRVVVRYARGAQAPASPRRGHGVHLRSKRAHTALLSRLARDTTYSVSIFALDRAGRASAPAVTRFTTPAKPTPGARGVARGTVTDTADHRLVNALVVAYDNNSGRSVRTNTNTEGAFVLGLPTGSWQIGASGESATGGNSDATGYSYDYATFDVAASRTVTPTFRLPAGARVSGRVVDTAGRPIVGALPYELPPFPYVTSGYNFFALLVDSPLRTNAAGRFVFRGTPAGEAGVLCASGVAARVAGQAADFLSACAKRPAAVAAGQTRTLPDLVMTRGTGTAVTGRLVGNNGRPLRGMIALVSGDDELSDLYGFADARGTFRIPGVPAGRYQACGTAASAAGSRTGWAPTCARTRVRVKGGTATHPVVRLPRGAAVSGTVTGPGGRRLANASVGVTGDEDGGYTTTDSRGQWRVTGLAAGKYRTCANGRDAAVPTGAGGKCWHGARTITVRAGRVRSGIDVRLPAAAGLAGTVRDSAGRPAAYAYVSVGSGAGGDDDEYDAYTQADAHGRYTAGGLAAGRYRACASANDDVDGPDNASPPTCTAPVRVQVGRVTRGADVVLATPTAIAVQVRDSAGLPVAGVDAAALTRCPDDCTRTSLLPGVGVDVRASAITDADGRATLLLDGAGNYAVCLFSYFGTTVSGGSPTGYADACHGRGFDIAVTAHTTAPVTMTLQPGGTVSGRVTDTAGHPVAEARIVVPGSAADDTPDYADPENDDGDDAPYPDSSDDQSFYPGIPGPQDGSRSGRDGRFTIIGVRPGTWTVCAYDTGYGSVRFGESCAGGANSPGVAVTAGADTRADIRVTRRG